MNTDKLTEDTRLTWVSLYGIGVPLNGGLTQRGLLLLGGIVLGL